MTRNGLTAAGLAALAVVLAADQGSKGWVLNGLGLPDLGSVPVLPGLNFTFVQNQGVTFGLFKAGGEYGPLLLAGVAVAIVVALGVWLRRAENPLVAIALGAIGGGAVGNIIDRLRFGWVVDFIHVHVGSWSWYVFNVADAAIVCGVGALLLDGVLPKRSRARDRLAGPGAPGL